MHCYLATHRKLLLLLSDFSYASPDFEAHGRCPMESRDKLDSSLTLDELKQFTQIFDQSILQIL